MVQGVYMRVAHATFGNRTGVGTYTRQALECSLPAGTVDGIASPNSLTCFFGADINPDDR